MVITYSKSKDQPDKVAIPARGQLNRKMNISLSPFAPENLVSRDGFDVKVDTSFTLITRSPRWFSWYHPRIRLTLGSEFQSRRSHTNRDFLLHHAQ